MGDGIREYKSDINRAFNKIKRININNNKEVSVVETSYNIKSKDNLIKEIENNNLGILSVDIVNNLPNFDNCISIVVKKK